MQGGAGFCFYMQLYFSWIRLYSDDQFGLLIPAHRAPEEPFPQTNPWRGTLEKRDSVHAMHPGARSSLHTSEKGQSCFVTCNLLVTNMEQRVLTYEAMQNNHHYIRKKGELDFVRAVQFLYMSLH